MTRIPAIALLVVATLIPSTSAMAQDHLEKATIPFNFNVGRTNMPAGTYRLTSSVSSPDVIHISSWEKQAHVLSLARPYQEPARSQNALVFHRYGNQYFLSDIRSSDSAMNVHFPTSKAEKRAKAEVEEAGLFAADPILVALR